MGSKPSSTTNTTSSYTPPPQVLANYEAVTQQAQGVAATPYSAFGGQLVAPVNDQQNTGIGAVNSASGVQNPYNAVAGGLAGASSASIDPTTVNAADISQYESPYQNDVINATEAEINNQNAQQAASLTGNNISSGAFGGDRAGVAQAALAGQQDIASNATLANLNNQNFSQALGEANTQQSVGLGAAQNTAARQLAASQQLGTLGNTAQSEALNEANAQTNAGTLEQTTQQAQDTAAYNQFLQQQAYPFQTTGWLANIVEGIGSQSGGTSTGSSTTSGPSGASSVAGGLLGLASFLKRGGRVPHRASGGGLYPTAVDPTNGQGLGGVGGGSYVPSVGGLMIGNTMPKSAPAAPAASPQAQSPQQFGQNMSGVAKGVQGLGNAIVNSSIGDTIQDAIQDAGDDAPGGGLGVGDPMQLSGGDFRRGGLVPRRHYDDGGSLPLYDDIGYDGNATPIAPITNTPPDVHVPIADMDMPVASPPTGLAPSAPIPDAAPSKPDQEYFLSPESLVHPDAMPQNPISGASPIVPGGLAPSPDISAMPAPSAPIPDAAPSKSDQGSSLTPESLLQPDAMPQVQPGGTSQRAIPGSAPIVPGGLVPRAAAPTGSAPTPASVVSTEAPAPTMTIAPASVAPVAHGLGAIAAATQSPKQPSMWAAPAYAGATPKGPTPDPANYPTTQAGQAAFIRDYSAFAGGKGIDPNFAMSVARAEGLGAITPQTPNGPSRVDIDPQTGKPYSYGAFQMNVKNGVGVAARAAGIDPADPAQANAANKFAMDYMATHGISPWKSDKAVADYLKSGAVNPALAYAPNDQPKGLQVAQNMTGTMNDAGPQGGPQTSAPQFPDNSKTPASGRTGLLGFNLSPETRQLMLSAGLGIMGGTSMNPWVNIGQGGLAGIAAVNKNRETAADVGLKGAQTGQIQTETALKQQQLQLMMKALDNNSKIFKGTPPSVTTPTVTAPSATAGSGASAGPAPAGGAGTPNAGTPSPAPQKQVAPQYDPVRLRAAAENMSFVNPAVAANYRDQAAQIESGKSMVQFSDGSWGTMPGYNEAAAATEAAKTVAQKGVENQMMPTVDPATGAKYVGGNGPISTSPLPAAPTKSFGIDKETAAVSTAIPKAPPGGGYIQPNLPPGAKLTEDLPANKILREQDGEFLKDQVSTSRAADTVVARTQALAQAFKTFESGALADKQKSGATIALALGQPGIAKTILAGDPAGIQWVEKEGVNSVLDTLKSATPRFAQAEFNQVAQNGTPNPTNQPGANHEMVAEMLALGERNKDFLKDWETAKGQGWASPSSFYTAWTTANPVGGYIKSAQRQIGNFAGMDLPQPNDWAAGAVYVAPKSLPPATGALLGKYGVQPGGMFRFNGRQSQVPVQPIPKSDYFSAQLGQ